MCAKDIDVLFEWHWQSSNSKEKDPSDQNWSLDSGNIAKRD
jgi:hypothetical protein